MDRAHAVGTAFRSTKYSLELLKIDTKKGRTGPFVSKKNHLVSQDSTIAEPCSAFQSLSVL
ncbi:hypothetical protein EMIT0232MI5_30097 [Pseudomonas sp. IT-232MI5]